MKPNRELLEQALQKLLDQLRGMPVKRVILFGSLAYGEIRASSDLDLLVIFDDESNFKERMRKLYDMLESPVDFDLLAYNEEEFERIKGRSFFRHILKEGKVIYEAG